MKSTKTKKIIKENRKIVRSYAAGVFFGTIKSRRDTKHGLTCVLTNARRLWYWSGASSLSQLAMEGVKRPNECKFPCAVDKVEVENVCEILDVTPEAAKIIDGVPVWKQ